MFKFYLKKNFADSWDNFFFLILSNLINIALIGGSYFAILFASSINQIAQVAAFVACSGIVMVSIFAWGANAAKIADFNTPSFGNFFTALKSVWKIGFVFGAVLAISLLILRFGIIYYLTMYFSGGGITGLLFTAVLAWFALVSLVALQWFIPLYYLQSDNGFVKCLKKSFIIFFDNAGFSIKVALSNATVIVLSIITVGLIPGLNGLLLSNTNALRLRLYKYDWIEKMSENDPDFINDRDKREEIPWDELLAEDKESLGPRKLSSFIFPWK